MFQSWLVDVSARIFQLHSIRSRIRTWFIWLRWIEVFCVSIETSIGMSNLNFFFMNSIGLFFSLRKSNRNDTIHDRQSFSFWVHHFSTTPLNWKMQITRVTHCHAGYQASFFKAPKKNSTIKKLHLRWHSPSSVANKIDIWFRRVVLCVFSFSVLLERNKI